MFSALATAGGTSCSQSVPHPWLDAPHKLEAAAYITNLSSGDRVASPFVVKFGMRHWGIAPTAHKQDIPRTGHYHLLIDAPLPSPIDSPIPFSKNYVHYGKGQMEAIVDLPPGPHSLRLLLANHDHIPFFVYSNLVKIIVTGKDPAALPATYGKVPHLEFLNVKDGDTLIKPFLLRFHASGLNIAHADTKLVGTGYFQLKLFNTGSSRNDDVTIPFPNGVTEAQLDPPKGTYEIQLQYVENGNNKLSNVVSKPLTITVKNK